MLEKQQQLYQRICAYELDDPSHEIGFLAHLMRANGWSRPFAVGAIEEYRKFVFLALVSDHQVTPSDQVDQVWHLHLLFSDAYWNDFCPRVLGRPLHHHPARGGQEERGRFHELYRATIRSYRQHFGEPPADLWPPVDVRFGRDLQMQRGPIRRMFRPWRGWRWRHWSQQAQASALLVALGLLACGIAKATAGASTDAPPVNEDLLVLAHAFQQTQQALQAKLLALCSMGVGAAVSFWLLRPLQLQPSCLSTTPELDDDHLAYLSAGPYRVIERGLASLVQAGVLIADPYTRTVKRVRMGRIEEAMPDSAQQVLRVYRHLALFAGPAVAYTDIATLSRYGFLSLEQSLQAQEMLPKGLEKLIKDRLIWVYMGWLTCFMCLAVPIWTIDSNTYSGNPILIRFHILLCFLLGLGLGQSLKPSSFRTLWGDAVLHHFESTSTDADPLRQVALLGLTAMRGGRLDDLRSLIENVEADRAAAAGCGCGC
jgi:uncharacterized protein (TIGR04222 family)